MANLKIASASPIFVSRTIHSLGAVLSLMRSHLRWLLSLKFTPSQDHDKSQSYGRGYSILNTLIQATRNHLQFHGNSRATDPERHQHFWTNTSGILLERLLSAANYPTTSQEKALEWFNGSVVPYLGLARGVNGDHSYKSFMTDDGTPIELSWDWSTSTSSPKIRYSIDPIHHLENGIVLNSFDDTVVRQINGTDLHWHKHFCATFAKATLFYAFDIQRSATVAKAYYILRSWSRTSSEANLAHVANAVYSAPQCSRNNLPAMAVLERFFENNLSTIDIEMFATDLVEPQSPDARLKIYFRSHETTFESVKRSMTLDGRIHDDATIRGLARLETLWSELFSVQHGEALPHVEHRTAGILYYAEFRLNNELPSVKIYLPVRHYARSDRAVLDVLGRHFKNAGGQYIESFDRYEGVMERTL